MIAVSILGTDDIDKTIRKINKTDAEMIHIDVLDSTYENQFNPVNNLENSKKDLNVHLMVKNQLKYIKEYEKLSPHSIVLQYELSNNLYDDISYLWNKNIRSGIAIAPETLVADIKEYLSLVDYVLVLTVHPGKSGQKFLNEVSYKVDLLSRLRKKLNLSFKIIVDGGINENTIKKCKNADVFVSGSFITGTNNFQERINILKKGVV